VNDLKLKVAEINDLVFVTLKRRIDDADWRLFPTKAHDLQLDKIERIFSSK